MGTYDPGTVTASPIPFVARQARLYEESDGAKGTDLHGAPCLLLDYKGQRSGGWHRTVLIFHQEQDDYFVVASKGGAQEHPQWYDNLQSNPGVYVRVFAERFPARAETLSAEEKARLWPELVKVWPAYGDYQAKTDREIPVIRLHRIE